MRHIDRPEAGFDELFDAGYEPLQDVPYDGATFGAAFFGWLVGTALAVLIIAVIAATGTALGWDRIADWSAAHANESVVITAGLLLLTLMASEFAGGYVGGRMVRTDGAKQGVGVWLLGVVAAAAISGAAYVTNRQYELTDRIDIPSWITAPSADHPRAGLIAALIVLLAALVATIVGGVSGNRYHRRANTPVA